MSFLGMVPLVLAALLAQPRTRVVVELFTSEGCSSCPRADELLARLALTQPIAGVEVVALELHVHYWNNLGWADPFSSAAYSARQQAYGRGVYTPQLVVAGGEALVGSDERKATSAIGRAALLPGLAVEARVAGDELEVHVPPIADPHEVWVAVTESGLSTDVRRGENAGHLLVHAPVVRRLEKIGATNAARGLHARVPLALDRAWARERLQIVVFAQRPELGRIAGATVVAVP